VIDAEERCIVKVVNHPDPDADEELRGFAGRTGCSSARRCAPDVLRRRGG